MSKLIDKKHLERLIANLKEAARRSSDFMTAVERANSLPDTFPKDKLSDYDTILQGLHIGSPKAASVTLKVMLAVFYELREEHFLHSDSEALDENGDPLPLRDEQLDLKFSSLVASLGSAHAAARKVQNLEPLQPVFGDLDQIGEQASLVSETRESGKNVAREAAHLHAEHSTKVEGDSETKTQFFSKLWDGVSLGRLVALYLQNDEIDILQFQKLSAFVSKLPEHIETAMEAFKIAIDLGEATGQQIAAGLSAVTKLCAGGLRTFADNVSKAARAFAKLRDRRQGKTTSKKPKWAMAHGGDEYGPWAEFEYKGIAQRLRLCPAGSFVMGSPKGEKGRVRNEGPQTEITFKNGFWMFDTAVTQELYTAVMGENLSRFQEGTDAAKRPVEAVSWDDAQEFLIKMNEAVPTLSLSLPSEAQWEYACRAGTSGSRYADDLDTIAWYNENSNGETHPVAEKAPNSWGLYDTLGNVDEWCTDVWQVNHEGADPTGRARQEISTDRVVRGGAWDDAAQYCRAACRLRDAPDRRNDFLGFRPIQPDS